MVLHEIKQQLQACAAALQFLTRFPIPVTVPFVQPVLKRSVMYFPLAGVLIGGCVAAAAWFLGFAVPIGPSAVLLLALWTGLSGGLHVDGWMDTADGVLSHRSRERMLEIMKDSRVGAMGVIAAVFLLLFKCASMAELLKPDGSGSAGLALLVLCPIWSRAWMVAAIAGWPSARKGEGIGSLFNGVKGFHAALVCIISIGLSWLVLSFTSLSIEQTFIILAGAAVLTLLCGGLLAVWLNHKLGGLTGDTYGAMNEAVEAVLLLAAVIGVQYL